MKNKVGAQKGAFIKMKQGNVFIYQWLCWFCCVPIIAPFLPHKSIIPLIYKALSTQLAVVLSDKSVTEAETLNILLLGEPGVLLGAVEMAGAMALCIARKLTGLMKA
ncbi:hypothetical protein HBM95_04840 [Enterobacter asburiae]|nr:hypothetical protein [Enterobacter asburiae]